VTEDAGAASTPAGIVPRWEWRAFGDDLGEANRLFEHLVPESAEQSDDLYLLSLASDASVKVRGGVLDVKRLEQVDVDGLEQWRPIAKTPFPVPARELAAALAELGVANATLDREAYELDELLEVVSSRPELLAVNVHKRRAHFTVAGCMAELSEVQADGRTTRTVVAESEDPAIVSALVRQFGRDTHANVDAPRGIKALVGFGSRRYAVVDVGTNSVKLHVGERAADGSWRTIVDRAEVTRLGEGLDADRRLGGEPIARTAAAVEGMVDEARRDGVEEIAAVGTAGLRIASNSAAFVAAVHARSGITVEVIPGDEEARLAYLAATAALAPAATSAVVFDTGGGSSQFTFGHGRSVEEQFSVNVGAARFTERFGLDGAVSAEVVAQALEAIAADLSRLDARPRPDLVIGLGGAVTNLVAVQHRLETYDPEVVQGAVLTREEVDRQIELYRTLTAGERRALPGLQPGRENVILAGACVVRTVLDRLGAASLTVSDRGLRHGVIAERFGS